MKHVNGKGVFFVYGEYEDKELKQLQQIELDVLKDFANVCDELTEKIMGF